MRRSYRSRQLIVFLGISLGTIILILFLTMNRQTFLALSHITVKDVAYLLLLWSVSLLFDGLSIYYIVRASGAGISLYSAIQTSAIKYFFNMITPFSFGGQPVMIYYLTKKNVPAGKSSSIVMSKLMLMAGWTFLGAIIAFMFYFDMIVSHTPVFVIFLVTAFLQLLFILSITFVMLLPQLFIPLLVKMGHLGQKMKILKKTDALKKMVIKEAALARRSFRHYFKRHLLYFSGAVTANGISYLSLLGMLYFVFQGLGVVFSPVDTMAFTAILFLVMGFFPTPGASGFAEGLFILFISASASVSILGVAVVIWRFFTHYLSMLLGFFFSAKHLTDFSLKKN